MPEKLHELQRLWLIEAVKYNVVPLDDRIVERFNPDTRRAAAAHPRQPAAALRRDEGPVRSTRSSALKNKSHAVTAEVVVPEAGREGRHHRPGRLTGGFSLYAKDGKLKYCYNFLGLEHFFVEGTEAIPAGKHQVRMEFAYDGGGLAKGGTVVALRRRQEGRRRPRRDDRSPSPSPPTRRLDVGMEAGSPVSPDYGPSGNAFNGEVDWVEIDVDKASAGPGSLPGPGKERFHVAMALQ